MEGAIITMIVVSPIACCIGLYKLFNHGQMPCINTSNTNTVVPEE